MRSKQRTEQPVLDSPLSHDLAHEARDRGLSLRQVVGRRVVRDNADRGFGDAGSACIRDMGRPDVGAIELAGGSANCELRVLRLDDALAVEELADLVPGPGEAWTVQHDR